MLEISKLTKVFEEKFRLLGVPPLFSYYGGSLANGSYERGKSDIDVIIVTNFTPFNYFKGTVGGEEYSFIFDPIGEYGARQNISNCSLSRLYGYLNFAFAREDSVFMCDKTIDIAELLENAKKTGEAAAKELFRRIRPPYYQSKELYHLGNAVNLLYGDVFSLEEIKEVKNGNPQLFLKKLEGERRKNGI